VSVRAATIRVPVRLPALALALALLAPALPRVAAAEPAEDDGFWSRISGAVGADFTNAYYFYGILQERHGFIAQPWGELYVNLFSSEEGPIRDITVGGGVWASFHTKETFATEGPHSLYETDWYPLLSVGLAGGLTFSGYYYYYTSPNGAFDTIEELHLGLAWDDSEVLGRLALAPYVNFAFEMHRTNFGDDEGVAMQVGVEPTLFEIPHARYPVTFTLPVELGLSIDDYYEEDDGEESNFGYLSWGLRASVPLAFMPESTGAWTFTLTGQGYTFSETLADANEGDDTDWVVTAGLSMEF
jgi:hypothetical protein